MSHTTRVKLGPDGTLQLPKGMLRELNVDTGDEVRLTCRDGEIIVERYVPKDPFAEYATRKKPGADTFDRILGEQARRKQQAKADWDRLMENPPEARPEDHPDFWR